MVNYTIFPTTTTTTTTNATDAGEIPLPVLVVTIVVQILGLLGNGVSFIVLSSKNLNKISSVICTYLRGLAVADSLVILTGFVRILPRSIPSLHVTDSFCKISSWANFVSFTSASWIICAVTLEKAVAVAAPLRVASFSSRTHAFRVTCVIFVLAAAMSSWNLVIMGPDTIDDANYGDHDHLNILPNHSDHHHTTHCDVYPEYESVGAAFKTLTSVTYLVIPVLILGVCNGVILYHIRGLKRRIRGEADKLPRSSGQPSRRQASATVSGMLPDSAERLTIMLSIVSITFLVLSLPMCVFTSAERWAGDFYKSRMERHFSLAIFASTINHCSNFLCYIATGAAFRRELASLAASCRRGVRRRLQTLPPSARCLGRRRKRLEWEEAPAGSVVRLNKNSFYCRGSVEDETEPKGTTPTSTTNLGGYDNRIITEDKDIRTIESAPRNVAVAGGGASNGISGDSSDIRTVSYGNAVASRGNGVVDTNKLVFITRL